jgi:IMP dehydrogenase/GMP reductase
MSFRRLLTFDDVGLVPKFNTIASRLNTNIAAILGKTSYNSPFIPANMDMVIGPEMAEVCRARGALGAKDIDEYREVAEFFEATQSYMHESNSRATH